MDKKFYNQKYDIDLGVLFELDTNRYKNRRNVREILNLISTKFLSKSRAAGWSPFIHADFHVVDRLTDREFPADEFVQIIAKLATKHEKEILKMVEERHAQVDTAPFRINCYGYGAWMLGVSISVYTCKDTGEKSYHLDIRTCYAERNMVHRKRNVDVHKIWTRGMPHWVKNPTEYVDPLDVEEAE